jgi:AbiV family abortive infection protein
MANAFEKPAAETLKHSIDTCQKNGKSLLDDAVYLFEWDRFSSALAIAVLAQEEFAKAFLLQLVADDAIPWLPEVKRSINSHECKHLLALVMDWLPAWDWEDENWYERHQERRRRYKQIYDDYNEGRLTASEFLECVDEHKNEIRFPANVATALNIYRHEEIERLAKRFPWRDDEWAKGEARKIAGGFLDAKKQSALFVDIGRTGAVIDHPGRISKSEAQLEIKRAKALSEERVTWTDEFYLLKEATAAAFKDLREKA